MTKYQVVGEAKNGDICGEIGVLFHRPQTFTVRTKRLSQLIRMKRTTFLNAIQTNRRDVTIIVNNLLQVCRFIQILVKDTSSKQVEMLCTN